MPIFDQPGGLGASTLTERNQPTGEQNLSDFANRLILRHTNPLEAAKLQQGDIENRIRQQHVGIQQQQANTQQQAESLNTFKTLMSLAGEGIINTEKAIPMLANAASASGIQVDEQAFKDMFSQPNNTVQAISYFQQLQQQGLPRDQAAVQTIQNFPQSKALRQLLDPIALEKPLEAKPSAGLTETVETFFPGRKLEQLTPDEKAAAARVARLTETAKNEFMGMNVDLSNPETRKQLPTFIETALNKASKRIEGRQINVITTGQNIRPIEASDRQAIAAMENTLRIATEMKDKYTPQQLQQYVGFMRFPIQRLRQITANDPKFAEFQTLVNMIKGTAFAEGGKQLTPFEASVVFGHVPTGTEFSVSDFVSKLDKTIAQTEFLVNKRYELATTGKGAISKPTMPAPVKPTEKKTVQQRFEELRKNNPKLTKQDIYKQLSTEGY